MMWISIVGGFVLGWAISHSFIWVRRLRRDVGLLFVQVDSLSAMVTLYASLFNRGKCISCGSEQGAHTEECLVTRAKQTLMDIVKRNEVKP